MHKELTGSAKKIQSFLIDNGFSCEVKELPESTRTAEEAARAIGCDVAQIAKSLIFIDKATGNPILIIASGINQVDIKKIEQSKGIHLVKADAKFVKERVGFAIGGIPPIGHNEKLMTYLYRSGFKNWYFGCFKASWLNLKKTGQYCNMNLFFLIQPRELSSGPNTDF